jgi:hypothetical protein
MSKIRAFVCVSLLAVFVGCGSESPAPVSSSPSPTATAAATKPAEKAVAASAPAPNLTQITVAWDAPVDGRPVYMKVRAEGVQIYQSQKDAAGAYAWKWVAPEALLYDDKGRNIGKHGAGPFWELQDGSKVIAAKVGEEAHEGTLPWVLMKTSSTNEKGKLAVVKYVKRIDTTGGLPPGMAASGDHAGKEERAPYRATYVFYAGS